MPTTKDIAEELDIDEQTVRRYAREGIIPFSETLGGHRRYDLDEVRLALARARATRFAAIDPFSEEAPRLSSATAVPPVQRGRYRRRGITRATIAEAQTERQSPEPIPFIGVKGSSRFVIGQGAGAR